MAKIDIRTLKDDEEITHIQFANAADDTERYDIAYTINHNADRHPDNIFVEAFTGDYITIRKSNIKNLIKALQKAEEIWGNK